jgi:hypothetical protein
MKRQACQLCLIIAAAAAPAAWAGSEIVRCVDAAGHVTLTDQQCDPGAAMTPMATQPAMTTEPAANPVQGQAQAQVERFPAPRALPRRSQWRAPPARQAALARDVATLKEARLQLMAIDEARPHQPRLAGIN